MQGITSIYSKDRSRPMMIHWIKMLSIVSICIWSLHPQVLQSSSERPSDIKEASTELYSIIFNLFNKSVGLTKFENYLNQNSSTEISYLNGSNALDFLREKLKKKLDKAISTVVNTVRYIQDEVSYSVVNKGHILCGKTFQSDTFRPRWNTQVDFNATCYNFPPYTENPKFPSEDIVNILKNQWHVFPQSISLYMTTEEGGLFRYPAINYDYGSYDPRVQPYYGYSVNLFHKDVVLIIDNSHKNGDFYFKMIKQVVLNILNSLHVHDRILFLLISDPPQCSHDSHDLSFDCCVFEALSSPSNYLRDKFPEYMETMLKSNTSVCYANVLKKAFDPKLYADKHEDHGDEDEHHRNAENPSYEEDHTSDNNHEIHSDFGHHHKAVVLITASHVPDLQRSTEVLKAASITWNSAVHSPHLFIFQVRGGIKITNHLSKLKKAYFKSNHEFLTMSSIHNTVFLYQHFLPFSREAPVLFPYADFRSEDFITTVTKPLYAQDSKQLIGLVGLDVKTFDLMVDLVADDLGHNRYAFVFDRRINFTLYHPFLPNSHNFEMTSAVDINNILKATQQHRHVTLHEHESLQNHEYLQDHKPTHDEESSLIKKLRPMFLGQTGHVQVNHTEPQHNVTAEYYFAPINLMSVQWSICLVVENTPKIATVRMLHPIEPSFEIFRNYDQSTVKNLLPDSCRYYYVRALNDSRILLTLNSFRDLSEELYQEETERKQLHFENIARQISANDIFVDGIVDDIGLTNVLISWWLFDANLTLDNFPYIVRRSIITNRGLVRTNPAPLLAPHKYISTSNLLLYANSVSDRNDIMIVSPPFKGSLGEGFLVTVAMFVMETTMNASFCTLGMDIHVHYLQKLVELSSRQCSDSYLACFLMDKYGTIISHPRWTYAEWPSPVEIENVRITELEKSFTNFLLLRGHLKWIVCYGLYEKKPQYLVELITSDIDDGDGYQLVHIHRTNVYLAIMYDTELMDNVSQTCNCLHPLCTLQSQECGCPCVNLPEHHECPHDKEKWTLCQQHNHIMVEQSFYDTARSSQDNFDSSSSDFCSNDHCHSISSSEECYQRANCRWCGYTTSGMLLPTPFCGFFHECWYGQLGRETLYPEFIMERLKEDNSLKLEDVLNYLLITVCVIFLLALIGISVVVCKMWYKTATPIIKNKHRASLPHILLTSTEGEEHVMFKMKKETESKDSELKDETKTDTIIPISETRICHLIKDGKKITVKCPEPVSEEPKETTSSHGESISQTSTASISQTDDSNTSMDSVTGTSSDSSATASSKGHMHHLYVQKETKSIQEKSTPFPFDTKKKDSKGSLSSLVTVIGFMKKKREEAKNILPVALDEHMFMESYPTDAPSHSHESETSNIPEGGIPHSEHTSHKYKIKVHPTMLKKHQLKHETKDDHLKTEHENTAVEHKDSSEGTETPL